MERIDAIEEGIAKKDIEGLRLAVSNICYTSRDFSSGVFDEAVSYIQSKGVSGFMDTELRGTPLISRTKNESEFTDDDFSDAVYELRNNFCNERIQDVKAIGKALYGGRNVTRSQNQSTSASANIHNGSGYVSKNGGGYPKEESHQGNNPAKWVIGGVVLVAVIIFLIIVISRD